MSPSLPPGAMSRAIARFEHVVVLSLVVMMMLVIALSTIDLGWLILADVLTPPIVLLDIDELLEIFGVFLLILIGIELLATTKAYLHMHTVQLELVVEVALIAIARKVIVLDVETYGGFTVIGIAALVLALAAAVYAARRARSRSR